MPVASPESVVRASASPMLDPIPMNFDSESVAPPIPPAGAAAEVAAAAAAAIAPDRRF